MLRTLIATAALGAAVLLAAPAGAQDTLETVVVTGMRTQSGSDSPHVFLVHRVDHLITKVRVVCDTREPAKRRQELKDTLRNMIREAAKTGTISLGVGDEIVADLTDKMLDKVIEPDRGKADTSVANVVVKTAVSKSDVFDDATGRIEKFIEVTPKAGRTEILRENEWELTIVGPEQYRPALVAKIAEDAKATAGLFGPGYEVRVEGLQNRVQWYQKGPLDLALYIPYQLIVVPPSRP